MSGGEMEDDKTATPLRGEAAWKAQRDAIDQHNAAAKKRAHEQRSATALAASERQRKLERREDAQLRALNDRLPGRG
jgi:hypothetical protein